MINFNLERFKKLPQLRGVIWQGGLIRMPAWMSDENDKPVRPLIPFWADMKSHAASKCAPRKEEPTLQTALDELIAFGLDDDGPGGRPFAIEVRNTELAAFLETKLAGSGIRIDVVSRLGVIDDIMAYMAEQINKRPEPNGAMSGNGVTLTKLRTFAEAASAYYMAQPWKELTDEDLIKIESPSPPAGMDFVSVLGHGGIAYGLGFFESMKQFEKIHTAASPGHFFAHNDVWSFSFGDITELPFADADLWEDHQLPVAGPEAYPFAMSVNRKKLGRPNASELAFLEGLLRALSMTTAPQLDAGSWASTVGVNGRETEYRFALVAETGQAETEGPTKGPIVAPDIMRTLEKQMARMHRLMPEGGFSSPDEASEFMNEHRNLDDASAAAPRNALEEAQELVYDAWDATGRKRCLLARKALEICPDCADAYVILAEDASNVIDAGSLYEKGVDAGRRALGEEAFQSRVGAFWGMIETRPYMRALVGLAECLWSMGREQEAIEHYREMLRLNPGDNQGVRYTLAACLLKLDDQTGLKELFAKYKGESAAEWLYVKALLAYRNGGDTKSARKQAEAALKGNAHVPAFLSGQRRLPSRIPDSFQIGNEDEAVICAAELREHWKSTPGAVDWLVSVQGGKGGKKQRA